MDGNGRQPTETERIDRMNRAAEAEKGPDDPQAVKPHNMVPLIVLACIAFVIAIGIIGTMYVRNHDGTDTVPVAQSQEQR
jgi:hypothetical protein